MNRYLLLIGLSAFVSHCALALDITNESGQVYSNVTVSKSQPDGLRIMHSKGVAFLAFKDLPYAIQQQYGYDPTKEKEFLVRRSQQELHDEVLHLIQRSGLPARLRIIQITEEGALATGYFTKEVEFEETQYQTVVKTVGLVAPGRPSSVERQVPVRTVKKARTERYDLPDRVYVAGIPLNLVDGDWFSTMIYPCGRYQYINTMGARATVERYATSPAIAKTLLGSRVAE